MKLTDVIALYQKAAELKEIEIEGISCHIGSLVESTAPYMSEIEVLSVFVNELLDRGIALKHFDIGGGWIRRSLSLLLSHKSARS